MIEFGTLVLHLELVTKLGQIWRLDGLAKGTSCVHVMLDDLSGLYLFLLSQSLVLDRLYHCKMALELIFVDSLNLENFVLFLKLDQVSSHLLSYVHEGKHLGLLHLIELVQLLHSQVMLL